MAAQLGLRPTAVNGSHCGGSACGDRPGLVVNPWHRRDLTHRGFAADGGPLWRTLGGCEMGQPPSGSCAWPSVRDTKGWLSPADIAGDSGPLFSQTVWQASPTPGVRPGDSSWGPRAI